MTHRGPFQHLTFCDSVILWFLEVQAGLTRRSLKEGVQRGFEALWWVTQLHVAVGQPDLPSPALPAEVCVPVGLPSLLEVKISCGNTSYRELLHVKSGVSPSSTCLEN